MKDPTEKIQNEIESVAIEPAELSAYMDVETANGALSPEAYLKYLKDRYQQVKDEYQALMFNSREARYADRKDMAATLSAAFQANYKSRKWIVRELRRNGIPIEDKYVL